MSQRETVIAAMSAALVTANVASGRVYRTRQEAIATLPAVNIEPVSATGSDRSTGGVDERVVVAINILAKGDTPDSAADATLNQVLTVLLSLRDLDLGDGVDIGSDYEVQWDFADFDLAQVRVLVNVHLRTWTHTL